MTLAMEFLRRQLAKGGALPELSVLAVAVGLVTGLVVLLFRWAIEGASWLIHGQAADGHDALGLELRVCLPILGAILLGVLLNRLPPDSRRFGVVHVMERLARHRGRLPWRGAVNQFVGGAFGLAMGLSGGREGPAVHLGAATSSLLGEAFRLPDNCVRTLVACGTAAAIGASFNTPMAGVIFAMEVVMMEYAIVSFIPIIIATVTATVLSRWFLGDVIEFRGLETDLRTLLEVPYIMFAGLVVGFVGGLFIALVKTFAQLRRWPFWAQASLAGAITGVAAIVAPEALGVGYDTVNDALLDNFAWTALLIILVAKTVASAACVGVGLPVGVIGPTLVMGALLGGLLGAAGNALAPDLASDTPLYVMLGMAGMMAAVLQAPLAALVAVLELTANPKVILPAMLIIAVATLTVGQLLRQRSVLLTTLATFGVRYPPHPAAQHLMRVGVDSLMSRSVVQLPQCPALSELKNALADDPDWMVIDVPGGLPMVLNAAEVVAYHDGRADQTAPVDLLATPLDRENAGIVDVRATLQEALTELNRVGSNALCVTRPASRKPVEDEHLAVVGVLTRKDIERQAWW
ncbi:MAG: chloride channel protein [Gammaproteobacteria bacterium]|nr:chloride channel protein [Gammaproteobacteria bacterium]